MRSKFNLFCLPHAGGSKYAFKPFVDSAPSFLRVIPLEYPGRGDRIQETPVTDAVVLARIILSEIKDRLNEPYAIYGHSMGTLVGFLLTREIVHHGYNKPKFLFFTGSGGPSKKKKDKIRHLLPEPEFIEELKTLGGVSEEVLKEKELMNFFLPIIRRDFQTIETYNYVSAGHLDIPINVAIGTEEDISMEEVECWQNETRIPIEVAKFHGSHFFIFEHTQQIMNLISENALNF